jgi:hypothetical protein
VNGEGYYLVACEAVFSVTFFPTSSKESTIHLHGKKGRIIKVLMKSRLLLQSACC